MNNWCRTTELNSDMMSNSSQVSFTYTAVSLKHTALYFKRKHPPTQSQRNPPHKHQPQKHTHILIIILRRQQSVVFVFERGNTSGQQVKDVAPIQANICPGMCSSSSMCPPSTPAKETLLFIQSKQHASRWFCCFSPSLLLYQFSSKTWLRHRSTL